MKILVISDTHGFHGNLEKVLETEKDFEYVLHLGDTEGWDPIIMDLFDVPIEFVAGNCDWASDNPSEKIVTLAGVSVFMTHGHEFYVSTRTDILCDHVKSCGCQVALYGHTHRPDITEEDGILIANPGSISRPRQLDHMPSYGILTIDENGHVDFEVKYLEE